MLLIQIVGMQDFLIVVVEPLGAGLYWPFSIFFDVF